MKTPFDKITRDELISRINSLNENSMAQWGKMNVCQMLEHCITWEQMVIGEVNCKRSFIGRLIGPMVLKVVMKEDSSIKHNSPTCPELVITATNCDMKAAKEKWTSYIEGYEYSPITGFLHPFFGQMTREQIGHMAYKHADHHLRQFNA